MAVPQALQESFDIWNRAGRKPQAGMDWRRKAWSRWLPDHAETLERFEDAPNRTQVTNWCTNINDSSAAMTSFLAASVWGHGLNNNGPFRTRRILDTNEAFASELLMVANIAQTAGGVVAFQHIVDQQARDRDFFKFYGPAFATKFIYFATKATPSVDTTPIMDSVVAEWFASNVPNAPLYPSWSSSNSYRRYVDLANEWAEDLEIEIDDVEQLVFSS